ncbi:uncharacterized protein [Nicotiana tomentosiformis]|uniref:uncharacterized protein n=1 Tax=Nicotiana tomentosiformis TaxID=4098 RepID=UPI00388C46DD
MGSALFWFENWTGLGDLYFMTPPDLFCDETVNNVCDVMQYGQWDEAKIRQILPEEFANHILKHTKVPMLYDVLDKPFWMLESRGDFSVKLAWEYVRRSQEPCNAYKNIWVKGLPFKIAFLMWKVWRNKLPVDD